MSLYCCTKVVDKKRVPQVATYDCSLAPPITGGGCFAVAAVLFVAVAMDERRAAIHHQEANTIVRRKRRGQKKYDDDDVALFFPTSWTSERRPRCPRPRRASRPCGRACRRRNFIGVLLFGGNFRGLRGIFMCERPRSKVLIQTAHDTYHPSPARQGEGRTIDRRRTHGHERCVKGANVANGAAGCRTAPPLLPILLLSTSSLSFFLSAWRTHAITLRELVELTSRADIVSPLTVSGFECRCGPCFRFLLLCTNTEKRG